MSQITKKFSGTSKGGAKCQQDETQFIHVQGPVIFAWQFNSLQFCKPILNILLKLQIIEFS